MANQRRAAPSAVSDAVQSAGEHVFLASSILSLAFSVLRHFALSATADIKSQARAAGFRAVQRSFGNDSQNRDFARPSHVDGVQHLDRCKHPSHGQPPVVEREGERDDATAPGPREAHSQQRKAAGDTDSSQDHHRDAAYVGVLLLLIGLYDFWVSLWPVIAAFGRLALELVPQTEADDPSLTPELLRHFLRLLRGFAKSRLGRALLFLPALLFRVVVQALRSMLRWFVVCMTGLALGMILSSQRV
ncbi:hypothetical protein N658DRAFT_505316 [Parathielavia hyrcaniae]|uniref:Uncharacterized protein n=1 Tax=Parathielavia hyrcaniae TaxID=113614 RepID=A0AAN6QA13_9PEZI|nr:hypothetical protein N658DRAFT_505316 [Parathielavia hyrcaniae]